MLSVTAGGGAAAIALGVAAGLALAVDLRSGWRSRSPSCVVPLALVDPPVILALWAALAVFSRYPGLRAGADRGRTAGARRLARARPRGSAVDPRRAAPPSAAASVVLALLLAWLTLSLAWAHDTRPGPPRASSSWYVNAAALVVLLTSLRTPRDVSLVVAAVVWRSSPPSGSRSRASISAPAVRPRLTRDEQRGTAAGRVGRPELHGGVHRARRSCSRPSCRRRRRRAGALVCPR